MPIVSLPDHLLEELEKNESGMIDGTQGPGVASYLSPDGDVRADIYIGLKLDGFELYQNISSVDSNIKMQFSVQPVVVCQPRVLTFVPDEDNTITIQVVIFNSCSILDVVEFV